MMIPQPPTILLTRPDADSARFAQCLREAGIQAEIVISPLLGISSLDVAPDFDEVRGVIFTSRNGVASVAAWNLPAWCVGQATRDSAAHAGWQAISGGGDAEALLQTILADAPAGPLLHVRGEHARGDLAARLSAAGIPTDEVVSYRQEAKALSSEAKRLIQGDFPLILPIFSPRTARHLCTLGPFAAPLKVVAMSAAVAQALTELDVQNTVIASQPNAEAMIEAISGLIDAG